MSGSWTEGFGWPSVPKRFPVRAISSLGGVVIVETRGKPH